MSTRATKANQTDSPSFDSDEDLPEATSIIVPHGTKAPAFARQPEQTKPVKPSTTGVSTQPAADSEGDDDDSDTYYVVRKISNWRYAATESKRKPNDDLADSANLDNIELLIHWEECTEPTWGDEAQIQESAAESVWAFWESLGPEGRTQELGLNDNMFVPLRVVESRPKAAKRKKANRGKKSTRSCQPKNFDYLVEWVGYRERTWASISDLGGDTEQLVRSYWSKKQVT